MNRKISATARIWFSELDTRIIIVIRHPVYCVGVPNLILLVSLCIFLQNINLFIKKYRAPPFHCSVALVNLPCFLCALFFTVSPFFETLD